MRGASFPWRVTVALLAAAAILVALFELRDGLRPLEIVEVMVGGDTPTTVYRLDGERSGPPVVIAHGFAGSRPLMESFAVTLARNGFTAVSFDFRGHGENPVPLAGDVTEQDGATRTLVAETLKVVDFARTLADGRRVALVGHSMASDIVVRAAIEDGTVPATVAVSMFSRAVTAEQPPNLLVVVGEWETFLAEEGRKAVAMVADVPPEQVEEGVTYGDMEAGTAREVVYADSAEHVAVLFSAETMAETEAWLAEVFGLEPGGPVEVRGPWIVLLLTGIVAMAWPLSFLLPRLAEPPAGAAGPGLGRVAGRAAIPAVVTPLVLWPVETGFLPVLVADYLAVHFLVYGAVMGLVLWRTGGIGQRPGASPRALLLAIGGVAAWTVGVLGLALDAWVASFMPHEGRMWLIGLLMIGTLSYMLADEWLTRGQGAPKAAKALSKVFMLLSLALAVALNLEDLFFLIIILPVIVVFFLLYGLFSGWVYRATGHPTVGAVANAIAFAWALGVTFPLLDG